MTASSYFAPGPNDGPPMFGPGGFAEKATPKYSIGEFEYVLNYWPGDDSFGFGPEPDWTEHSNSDGMHEIAAIALCEKAAMGWIMRQRYPIAIRHTDGLLSLNHTETVLGNKVSAWRLFDGINGSPDWLAAARWANKQTKEKKH